ncbi:MAG: hypothetical protein ACUVYA_13445 [Planctomycetota bacterium]
MSREIMVSRALGLRGACGARGGRPLRPPEPYACIRVNVAEKGIDTFRVFGIRCRVTCDPVRTKSPLVALGESPICVVGLKGAPFGAAYGPRSVSGAVRRLTTAR